MAIIYTGKPVILQKLLTRTEMNTCVSIKIKLPFQPFKLNYLS